MDQERIMTCSEVLDEEEFAVHLHLRDCTNASVVLLPHLSHNTQNFYSVAVSGFGLIKLFTFSHVCLPGKFA